MTGALRVKIQFMQCKPFHFYTAQILIRITLKLFIGFNALYLPLWHSITFHVFLQIQRNFQSWKFNWLQLFMQTIHLMVDGCAWVVITKCQIFEIPSKNSCLFLPYFKKCDEEHMFILSIFRWNQFVTDRRSFGHNSQYRKISIRGPCSNRGPFSSLDAKNADFSSKFPQKSSL